MKGARSLIIMAILTALAAGNVAAAEKTVFVNSNKCKEDMSEVIFLKQPDGVDKSDGAIIIEKGKKGEEIYLIDGGMPNGTMLKALNSLRSHYMNKYGIEGQEKNSAYKLKINLIITHFHQDHVNELINNVLPNKRFSIASVYYAEPTVLSAGGEYNNEKNSDLNERVKFFDALESYHKDAKRVELKFGSTLKVNTVRGCFTFFAPIHDWGEGQWLDYVKRTYYADASSEKLKKDVPTAVINANSMFIRYEADGKSVLFPGDVMKKKERADEPLDLMIGKYGDQLRSDIVKYPHHGIERNAAINDVLTGLVKDSSSLIIISSAKAESVSAPLLKEAGAKYLNSALGTVMFTIDRKGIRDGGEKLTLF